METALRILPWDRRLWLLWINPRALIVIQRLTNHSKYQERKLLRVLLLQTPCLTAPSKNAWHTRLNSSTTLTQQKLLISALLPSPWYRLQITTSDFRRYRVLGANPSHTFCHLVSLKAFWNATNVRENSSRLSQIVSPAWENRCSVKWQIVLLVGAVQWMFSSWWKAFENWIYPAALKHFSCH